MVSRTARYYHTHPKARARKRAYDTAFNRKPSQRKKRSILSVKNRQHDRKYGKASRRGMDLAHTSRGLVYKKRSVNRGSKSDMPGDKRARGGKK